MSTTIALTSNFTTAFQVLPFIDTLDQYYPDIRYWYVNKVIPGLMLGDDKLLVARDQGNIVGICLGKKEAEETKLRCVRVLPEYQHQGLGIRLMDQMLGHLETRRPVITVAEELFHQYSRIFHNRYGFTLDAVQKGQYRPRKLEYSYNLQ